MKKILGSIALLIVAATSYGQFGIMGGYQVNSSTEWQAALLETRGITLSNNRINNGWSVGIDYWFRLKNKRIEFLPEVRASRTDLSFNIGQGRESLSINTYAFNFNTHIYPFDFAGDCDCPVWSKEGPSFSKGFFIRLSPGIGWWQSAERYLDISEDATNMQYSVAAGVGMDIGLSDLLTITPLIEHRWNNRQRLIGLATDSAATNWLAGVRLGIRLDD